MGNALKPASDRTFAPSEAHGGGDIELQVIAQGQPEKLLETRTHFSSDFSTTSTKTD